MLHSSYDNDWPCVLVFSSFSRFARAMNGIELLLISYNSDGQLYSTNVIMGTVIQYSKGSRRSFDMTDFSSASISRHFSFRHRTIK